MRIENLQAARVRLVAHEPIWFRGLDVHGNGWDPRILHATALNHALAYGLGYRPPDYAVAPLWCLHSRPFPKFPAWISPAQLVEDSLIQMAVFRGGRAGETLGLSSAPPAPGTSQERGAAVFKLQANEDGTFGLASGKAPSIGKPFLTDGYLGEWTAVLFSDDPEIRQLVTEPFLIRLGPNRVPVEVRVGAWEPLRALREDERMEASHLCDPWLLPVDAPVLAVHARPYPLAVALATHLTPDGVACRPHP